MIVPTSSGHHNPPSFQFCIDVAGLASRLPLDAVHLSQMLLDLVRPAVPRAGALWTARDGAAVGSILGKVGAIFVAHAIGIACEGLDTASLGAWKAALRRLAWWIQSCR
jgi:hypothetical protein